MSEFIQVIKKEGPVRVDLLGGTLDLNPINLIIPDVVTLNCATELKARVTLKRSSGEGIKITSKDYQSETFIKKSELTKENLRSDFFGPLKFIAQIVNHFGISEGLDIELESGSPAGAGLGGSSAMGVTFYSALCDWVGKECDREVAIREVNRIEARILDSGPAGYQDYYPALYGGVLALKPSIKGVGVEQLFTKELKEVLESSLTLVYSGETRLSGINNWEVYKSFFNQERETRAGLHQIADLSAKAYQAIVEGDYDKLIENIKLEGMARKSLFPGIVSSRMDILYNDLRKSAQGLGLKVCGAGGGGCFLLIHDPKEKDMVTKASLDFGMRPLELSISPPLS